MPQDPPLPDLPCARAAEATASDARATEAARYKFGRIASDDADGYHRVPCPAIMGWILFVFGTL
ncbi:MAG: hypothetical protein JWM19_1271 [Actinomycetia bacterium]|nr:hypothetical protein [Actinomycetes bacterium]